MTVDALHDGESAPSECSKAAAAKHAKEQPFHAPSGEPFLGEWLPLFVRYTDSLNTVVLAQANNGIPHDRVKMKVLMAINVRPRKTCCGEPRKLLLHLRGNGPPRGRREEVTNPRRRWVGNELAVRRDGRGPCGCAITERYMQPSGKGWGRARQIDRLGRGGLVHHQARGGEHALGMRTNNRAIGPLACPKIVRIENHSLHAESLANPRPLSSNRQRTFRNDLTTYDPTLAAHN